jgi:hypothetical protein
MDRRTPECPVHGVADKSHLASSQSAAKTHISLRGPRFLVLFVIFGYLIYHGSFVEFAEVLQVSPHVETAPDDIGAKVSTDYYSNPFQTL